MSSSTQESVEQFMARALHDPVQGYYARRIRTVGKGGDFSTTATLSPALGKAIARWLRSEARQQPGVRDVIEIGAGDGSLMAAVRASLGWWQRRRFRFHLVESSQPLSEQQKARLGPKVTWHQDLPSALKATGGKAWIYHNELLDAFPVQVVQWNAEAKEWEEVWLNWQAGSPSAMPQETFRPLSLKADERARFSVLSQWNEASPPPAARQRCELAVAVRAWLKQWASSWKAGAMFTMDYGDTFPALYHRRPRGTLRAYLLHQCLEGMNVYANPGRQDITADVNLTDYRKWASELGWREAAYGTQTEWLAPVLKPSAAQRSSADAFLTHSEGAGNAFKYVIHRPV